MGGKIIDKLPHSCGTRRGLNVYLQKDGSIDGHCFACGANVPNPYGDKPDGWKPPKPKQKTEEEIREEFAELMECPTVDLVDRRLRKDALEYFGIKVGLNERDGKTPDATYFPYYRDGELVRIKCRLLNKKIMWNISLSDEVDLFGWQQAVKSGSKELIIVEGEYDAVALHRIFEIYTPAQYKDRLPAIVSLPNGSSAAYKDVSKVLPKIRKHFKDIKLCFDQDDAGNKAVEEVLKLIPEAKVINLPSNDANACILEGTGKAAYQECKWNAEKPKNTRLVWGNEVHEKAKEPPAMGVPWPWPNVTDLTRGIRTGETIYIGAAQKMGKSEIVNALGAHLVKEVGWKIMMAKPEEANVKTYKLVAGKIAGKVFHDPKVEFDEEAYEKAGEYLKDKLCMVNLYQHLGWDTLKADIRLAAAEGCKAIFIDPITNLVNGMSSGDQNTKLQEIAQELSAMAKDLDVVIFIFCHLRNPEGGPPHDRGGKVLTSQFSGSRAMGRSCNYMFGLEGNKDPELPPEERNIRRLVCLDDREFGEVGVTNLYWNKATHLFTEMKN